MITFLGLGRMGTPMATQLLDAGHQLTVWNRSSGPGLARLAARGATVAPTVRDAVASADVVLTMLADAEALEAVATEVVPALAAEATWIEMSSVGPRAITELAARVPHLVHAPVMGSVDQAAGGTLTVLAGGDTTHVGDLLKVFGTVVECGDVADSAARKLYLITAAVASVALAAEVVALGRSLGVPDPVGALEHGPLRGAVARVRATGADFPLRLAAKDVGLALLEYPSPVLASVLGRLLAAPDLENDIRTVVA